ncbi:jg11586 [Pararge aegeria aegeria]|uniref:Jg11586 protein n=1 Tax=Pararge aegeria aegeria TaxID=348720 RepID=A0A8S4RTB6_9NEOP|nr:jg11586 [Pararge aegeria aegeria]
MKNQLKIPLILAILHAIVKCSQVIDKIPEQTLFATDYCMRLGVCPEGTHIMCTHFNPQWDPELSTLAQVWANTCIISVDMCRATKRFPDPAQLAGLTRFDENWIPINARKLFNYTGFSLEKVKYGIHSMLRSWYRTKQSVHPEDITEADDIWPKHLGSNAFLALVHGRVTHVGCGISVFKEYSFHASVEHKVDLIHNVVRVVCNLSSRLHTTPRKDRVYKTDAPTQVGYTVKCGCPIGYDEDEDCLCYESGRKLPSSCNGIEKKPPVVVLPIFTVENVPSKLNIEFRKNGSNCNTSTNELHLDHLDYTRLRRHDLRGSVFLKPSVFELPPRKLMTESALTKNLKKDVRPRKDFSNVRYLVSKYLNIRRRSNMTKLTLNDDVEDSSITSPSKQNNFMELTRRRIVYDNISSQNTNISNGDSNNKLINLLNKLEEEAKYVKLACDRKKLLDHKIRKIYNAFAEKAFMPKINSNINKATDETLSLTDFLENKSSSKNEQQFISLRKKNLVEVHNNKTIPNIQPYKNTNTNSMKVNLMDGNLKDNSFTYDNEELLEILNKHGNKINQNSKGEKTTGFQNVDSLMRPEEDLLTLEKRQFYQDKLNYLERKLQDFSQPWKQEQNVR